MRLWGDWITRFNTTEALTNNGGMWTVTVGPLAPGKHMYLFLVDEFPVPDPGNPAVALGTDGFEGNLIEVPGSGRSFDVPHGVVHIHRYRSSNGRGARRFAVYTPPGYSSGGRRYPLLVLLHGSGSNELGWTSVGEANLIVDTLIAEGRMEPVVIVLPDGQGSNPADDGPEKDLLQDVLPAVDSAYHVTRNVRQRAIAGASMGSFQALAWGLRFPDRFGAWPGRKTVRHTSHYEAQTCRAHLDWHRRQRPAHEGRASARRDTHRAPHRAPLPTPSLSGQRSYRGNQ